MTSPDDFLSNPYYNRLRSFLDVSNQESDRGKILVVTSLLEEMLAEIIESFLIDDKIVKELLYGNNAPLQNLYSRNIMAYTLGLIDEWEYNDINYIRKIRNKFAHSIDVSFETADVKKLTLKLTTGMEIVDNVIDEKKIIDPRARFSMVSVSLVSNFYNRCIISGADKRIKLVEKMDIIKAYLNGSKMKASI